MMETLIKINKKNVNILFVLFDVVTAGCNALYCIHVIHTQTLLHNTGRPEQPYLVAGEKIPALVFLAFILFLLYLSGLYRNKINLSIKSHLSKTFTVVALGYLSLFIYYFGLYNLFSLPNTWNTFLKTSTLAFVTLNLTHMVLIIGFRSLIKRGYWGYKTIVITSENQDHNYLNDLYAAGRLSGNIIMETICISGNNSHYSNTIDPDAGFNEINESIGRYNPEEIILALNSEHENIATTVISVAKMRNIRIKLSPDLDSIIKGLVKINKVVALPFVVLPDTDMPVWQSALKRTLDIAIATFSLLILLPFFPFIAYRIKKSSDGPVFYTQERIGKNGKPFRILKFRTMVTGAEKNGPMLSSLDDERVTPYGRFLRRWRIDEIPQFINVLRGDMAIVGPRPERSYFIEQITRKAPHFSQVLHCRPGITSLGMVKYGYAENVDQMIKRLNYDLIYMENLSFGLDIRILLYTLKTILSGEGK